MCPRLSAAALGVLGLLGAACSGRIEGETTGPSQGHPGSGSGSGSGSASGVTPISDHPACGGGGPAAAFIRRLTRFEYDSTVNDLLGDRTRPAAGFPADTSRGGFDNNAEALTVSPLLTERYMLAAEQLAAGYLTRNERTIPLTAGCDRSGQSDEDDCARKFLVDFSTRAYRRPAAPEDLQTLIDVYAAGKRTAVSAGMAQAGFRSGLKLAIATALQSPRFLYRVEFGLPARAGETAVRLDSWEIASRLSYLLWGSMPDAALFAAAAAGELSTREQIAAQVVRMLGTGKARQMVAQFHDQWLALERLGTVQKDARSFPGFSAAIADLMATETRRFLDAVWWAGPGDLRSLFIAPYTFNDATLAGFYGHRFPAGANGKPAAGFQRIDLDTSQARGGLMTQGSLLTLLANADQTSPVRRGKFVREQVLCQQLPPPPANAMIVLPALDPRLTTRERFTRHSTDAACAGCHTLMDPIGLGFESFDGVGVYRASEGGKAIDASGEIRGVPDGIFAGAIDLGRKLGASDEVRACFASKWFQFAYGREPDDNQDRCNLDVVRRGFAAHGYRMQDLLVALTETDAFLFRPVVDIDAGGAP